MADTTEKEMQVLLRKYLLKKNRQMILPNVSMAGWEADIISYTKAGFCHEMEIKVSRSDFLSDFKKRKHMYMDGRIPLDRYQGSQWWERFPNYFWYVCPWGLIQPDEIPLHAGLIWMDLERPVYGSEIIWDAPRLHKSKITDRRKEQLFDVAYWRMWSSYDKIAKLEERLNQK